MLPATALPGSPAGRKRAGMQAAGAPQELCACGEQLSHHAPHLSSHTCWAVQARAEPGSVPHGHRCLRQAGWLAPWPRAPELHRRVAPGLGMPHGSPCIMLSPPYLSKQLPAGATGHAHHGGHRATPCARGRGPPSGASCMFCKWCCQAGQEGGPGSGARMIDCLPPAVSPRMGTREPGAWATGGAGAPAHGMARPGRLWQPGAGGLALLALTFLGFISLAEEAISSPRGSHAWLTLSSMLSRLIRESQTRSPLPHPGAPGAAPRGAPLPRWPWWGWRGGAHTITPRPDEGRGPGCQGGPQRQQCRQGARGFLARGWISQL